MAGVDRKAKGTSDLGVRTASAVVMVAIAGAAVWIGGNVFNFFAAMVGIAVLSEWVGLTQKFNKAFLPRLLWILGGLAYVFVAVFALGYLNGAQQRVLWLLTPIGLVIATDVGAYFTGRTLGGPKIAPKISPSKTWSGLLGGMVASALLGLILLETTATAAVPTGVAVAHVVVAALVAVLAQAGDFFESWMKRRAGVKDSGKVIPGHGGVFDRVDGLLAVLFVIGLFAMYKTYA